MKALFIAFMMTLTTICYANDLDLIISKEEIASKIDEVATQINQEYQDKELTVIMVMKGAVCVTADLIRQINVPLTIEYVSASSYGHRGTTGGELTIRNLKRLDLKGKDVLLIDDIFDTGKTLVTLVKEIQKKQPNSIKTLTLLVKDVPRKTNYLPDYVLFTIPNRFVIGYGLDYKELYRNLPAVYAFPNDTPPF
jgi:hypoxanthine phosphoribosyltransferase